MKKTTTTKTRFGQWLGSVEISIRRKIMDEIYKDCMPDTISPSKAKRRLFNWRYKFNGKPVCRPHYTVMSKLVEIAAKYNYITTINEMFEL